MKKLLALVVLAVLLAGCNETVRPGADHIYSAIYTCYIQGYRYAAVELVDHKTVNSSENAHASVYCAGPRFIDGVPQSPQPKPKAKGFST